MLHFDAPIFTTSSSSCSARHHLLRLLVILVIYDAAIRENFIFIEHLQAFEPRITRLLGALLDDQVILQHLLHLHLLLPVVEKKVLLLLMLAHGLLQLGEDLVAGHFASFYGEVIDAADSGGLMDSCAHSDLVCDDL